MRVIFMGTPDFAVGTLEEIIKAGHEVVLVVSQPDKAVGRSRALKYTPVKECAVAHGIEVYQPAKIRAEESVEYLRQYNADIIIVEAFGQIIPKAILDMPHFGCVNVHASLLPKYRGAAPIQWAVLNGDHQGIRPTHQQRLLPGNLRKSESIGKLGPGQSDSHERC